MSTRAVLLALALLAGACQTAGDQLIDLPPSDRATASPTTEAAATDTGTENLFCQPALAAEMPDLHPSVDGYGDGVVELTDRDAPGNGCGLTQIPVLVADTPDERAHGLMEVDEVPDGVGMWFAGYDEDRTGGFYMFGTLTDLDIAYVAADGTIVDIVEMVVCEDDDPNACPTYPPSAPYRTTLEVTPGWFDDIGITVGDRITLVEG